MSRHLSLFLLLFLFVNQAAYSQLLATSPKGGSITVKKADGADLLVPIELDFVNLTSSAITPVIEIDPDFTTPPAVSKFSAVEISSIKIVNGKMNLSINANETKETKKTFYLWIDKSISVNSDKIVYLTVSGDKKPLCTIKLTIQPDDKILSIKDYLKCTNVLDYVTKVESNNNILTVSGYRFIELDAKGNGENVFLKKNVELKRGQVLAVNEWGWVFSSYYWKPVPISLITVPFKVRPKTMHNEKEFSSSANSGITNLGFNLELGRYQMDRYFSSGKKSTHKFSLGFMAAPSVEELDSIFTFGANGALGKGAGKVEKSKQLFISTGITLSYTYNDISFVFVPAGWDFATSSVGKSWVYDKKRWWGFGIAINPKIFATVLNK